MEPLFTTGKFSSQPRKSKLVDIVFFRTTSGSTDSRDNDAGYVKLDRLSPDNQPTQKKSVELNQTNLNDPKK